MADPPMAAITEVGIAAGCWRRPQEFRLLDGLGRQRDEACGILRRDSIRLPGRETAPGCRHRAAEPWVPLGARAWARGTSHASLTGIFILSAASTRRDRQRTRRSTTLLCGSGQPELSRRWLEDGTAAIRAGRWLRLGGWLGLGRLGLGWRLGLGMGMLGLRMGLGLGLVESVLGLATVLLQLPWWSDNPDYLTPGTRRRDAPRQSVIRSRGT